ncbi:unnamed protein product [Adineta steineri]|uniref:Uncharacterized protein n=1 Tax=Adineta steineri TaxID=433720 RepID=A0A813TYG7_9BILA|nr:unnamed protein product [Adineta steineri]CAF4084493.1 unnamed protein product [Adineta steineri]
MKTWLVLQILCGIFPGIGIAYNATLKSQINTDTTTQYYRKLMVQDTSTLIELNMFLTAISKDGDLHHHYSSSISAKT